MDLHPDTEKRTEELENLLYDALLCIVNVTMALDRAGRISSPELEGWVADYHGKPHEWRVKLGDKAIRRIQRERRGGQ